ncbi:hypothetical protein B0H34DRAFT_44193 [Crassisporium funariophilum]|nr:hypothetical protein B0H34DRAFT_44193 [Crassisporium funariophilum]
MTLRCSPITPATVHIVLDHICPLSAPLPPHLISRPLLQRHHFLRLSIDNPADYLAWPSAEQSHAVQLLQNQQIPSHEIAFPIQYTADSENITAHVRITSDLWLSFIWDPEDGWQYHNVALMPFPSNSYTNFSDAFAAFSPDDFLPQHNYTVNVAEDDDDSYWDSYGQGEHADHATSGRKLDVNPNSEDAYWAQYATVHGSGDSTLPSPLPEKKTLAPDLARDDSTPERIIVPSDDLQLHHVAPYNPLEPPSPEHLSRRLAALSSCEINSPPPLDDSSTSDSDTPSPHLTEVNPAHAPSFSSRSPYQLGEEYIVPGPASTVDDAAQDVLRDSIKTVFRLWKLGRQDKPPDQEKDFFLSTVRQALDQL